MAVDRDTAELAAFEGHLDVHGSRAERWPEAVRSRFEPLLERSARARELLAEARALESLLDRAPLPDPQRTQALADRVVAMAVAEKTAERTPAPVIDLATRKRMRRSPAPALRWKVASALAASLLAGVYLGASPPVTFAVEAIASAVGVPADTGGSDLVLIYDPAVDEEDFL